MPTYDEVRAMLRSLGLKKSEVSVYWALHKANKPLSVSEIVLATGLSEKTVRLALRELLRHGYIVKAGKKKATVYAAVSLKDIAEKLKRKIEEKLADLLSHLQFP